MTKEKMGEYRDSFILAAALLLFYVCAASDSNRESILAVVEQNLVFFLIHLLLLFQIWKSRKLVLAYRLYWLCMMAGVVTLFVLVRYQGISAYAYEGIWNFVRPVQVGWLGIKNFVGAGKFSSSLQLLLDQRTAFPLMDVSLGGLLPSAVFFLFSFIRTIPEENQEQVGITEEKSASPVDKKWELPRVLMIFLCFCLGFLVLFSLYEKGAAAAMEKGLCFQLWIMRGMSLLRYLIFPTCLLFSFVVLFGASLLRYRSWKVRFHFGYLTFFLLSLQLSLSYGCLVYGVFQANERGEQLGEDVYYMMGESENYYRKHSALYLEPIVYTEEQVQQLLEERYQVSLTVTEPLKDGRIYFQTQDERKLDFFCVNSYSLRNDYAEKLKEYLLDQYEMEYLTEKGTGIEMVKLPGETGLRAVLPGEAEIPETAEEIQKLLDLLTKEPALSDDSEFQMLNLYLHFPGYEEQLMKLPLYRSYTAGELEGQFRAAYDYAKEEQEKQAALEAEQEEQRRKQEAHDAFANGQIYIEDETLLYEDEKALKTLYEQVYQGQEGYSLHWRYNAKGQLIGTFYQGTAETGTPYTISAYLEGYDPYLFSVYKVFYNEADEVIRTDLLEKYEIQVGHVVKQEN